MTRLFISSLIACALAASSPSSLSAQDTDAPTMGSYSKKGLEVRLLAIDLLDKAEEVLIRSGEGQSKKISLPTANLSKPIRVADRKLILAQPATGSEKLGRTVAQVSLPQSGRRFLLLLVPAKDSYQCWVVRLDDPKFKPDHVCFFNLSQVEVAGALGKRSFRVSPGKLVFASPSPQADLPYYQVRLFYKRGDQARPIADTRWPYDNRSRSYVIFFSKGPRLTYRAVDEMIDSKEKK